MDYYNIDLSEEFEDEFNYIIEYTIFILKNPIAAKTLFEEIPKAIRQLETFPNRNQIVKDGIRRIRVKKYHIYYSVDEQMKIVNILHILYQGMDTSKIANWN